MIRVVRANYDGCYQSLTQIGYVIGWVRKLRLELECGHIVDWYSEPTAARVFDGDDPKFVARCGKCEAHLPIDDPIEPNEFELIPYPCEKKRGR